METDGELERPQRFGSRLSVVLVGRVNFFLLMSGTARFGSKEDVPSWKFCFFVNWSVGHSMELSIHQKWQSFSWARLPMYERMILASPGKSRRRPASYWAKMQHQRAESQTCYPCIKAGRGPAFHQLWTVTAFVPLRNHVPRSEAVVSKYFCYVTE